MRSLKTPTAISEFSPTPVPPAQEEDAATAIEIPGHEFPTVVYLSIIGAFAWMLAIAWIAFASADGTDLDLGMVTMLALMFFGIPLAMHHTSLRSTHEVPMRVRQFMRTSFDTYTGTMPAAQAWIEVAIIPVALALAATVFGLVYILS